MVVWRRETAEAIGRQRADVEENVRKKHLAAIARIRARESEYRRAVVGRHMHHCLQRAYQNAKFPCSPWWLEYLHCVVRIVAVIRLNSTTRARPDPTRPPARTFSRDAGRRPGSPTIGVNSYWAHGLKPPPLL